MKGRVLIVAGSDSGGGAGIQADVKTVTALNGFAMTAITALTAQNTRGVYGIHPVPESFIYKQMELVLDDVGADAVKTGMLHSAGVIETVVAALEAAAPDVHLPRRVRVRIVVLVDVPSAPWDLDGGIHAVAEHLPELLGGGGPSGKAARHPDGGLPHRP